MVCERVEKGRKGLQSKEDGMGKGILFLSFQNECYLSQSVGVFVVVSKI